VVRAEHNHNRIMQELERMGQVRIFNSARITCIAISTAVPVVSTFPGNCFEKLLQSCRPHFPRRIFSGLRPGLATRASRLVNKTGKLRFSGHRIGIFAPLNSSGDPKNSVHRIVNADFRPRQSCNAGQTLADASEGHAFTGAQSILN